MTQLQNFIVRSGRATVHFGPNAINALERWVSQFRRVFIVTSRRAARVSGALDDVLSILTKLGVKYEHYDGVVPNPSTRIANDVGERVWRFGAEAIVAIGGGSVIDVAKIASIIAECGGKAEEYIKRVREVCAALPVAAINLTHGTGSEINRYAVATIEETHEKLSVASDHIYPAISIDDPRYLKTLPKNQTIYTSLDALYHAIEAATTKTSSPYTVMLGEEVVKLIAKWLPVALQQPENLEARYWLLYASMLAGIAIDHGRTHLVHAMEHALSGLKPELAHGAGLAILGPHIVIHIYRAMPEVMHRLLRHLDPSLEPTPDHAEKASEALARFQRSVGFTERLSDYGFTPEHFDTVARLTMESTRYLIDLAPFNVTIDMLKEVYAKAL
ncbi:MAG TPA: iron-containing alcohol dehydrogenase [Ignisphaera aggregans]|uniref:Iron-containing alcohol dehydrogenase n=1 Tax=Ignisphaera aggregans TaxID=334771 RepID=A0A833DUN1_9CREN|nr:iron-containing alcohol dehydrogenase [Ignisphaera aggregans]